MTNILKHNQKPSDPAALQSRIEMDDRPSRDEAKQAVETLLRWIDPRFDRTEIEKTPNRVVKAFEEYFGGYYDDPEKIVEGKLQPANNYSDIVILRDIPFYSHCEHHMAVFKGVAHVGYVPQGYIVGLSKVARLVDCFAHRLQNQERLTLEIAESIFKLLASAGTAVIIEAAHNCIELRGIRKPNVLTVTRHFTGCFTQDAELRKSFEATVKG